MLRGPLFGRVGCRSQLLGAKRTSPPFVFTRTGAGPVRARASRTARPTGASSSPCRRDSPIGLVAFGGGNGFVRSIEFFAEIEPPHRAHPLLRRPRRGGAAHPDQRHAAWPPNSACRRSGRPSASTAACSTTVDRPPMNRSTPRSPRASPRGCRPTSRPSRPAHLVSRRAAGAGGRRSRPARRRRRLGGRLDELAAVVRRPTVARPSSLPAGDDAIAAADDGERPVARDRRRLGRLGQRRPHAQLRPSATRCSTGCRAMARRTASSATTSVPTLRRANRLRDLRAWRKGAEFEAGVLRLLRTDDVRIGDGWEDARSAERAAGDARGHARRRADHRPGRPAQPGQPDLRHGGPARSLRRARPPVSRRASTTRRPTKARPALGLEHVHYRVVDIKFHTFDLLADGSAAGDAGPMPYLVQVWLYNEALGRIAGCMPPAGVPARPQLDAGRGTRDGLPRTTRPGRPRPLLPATGHDPRRHRRRSGRRGCGGCAPTARLVSSAASDGARALPARAQRRGRAVARARRSRSSRPCTS